MTQNFHIITLQEAETLTHAFQNSNQFQGLTVACKIDSDAYQQILNQPDCVDVRTYFALNSNNELTIVVVGVNSNGEDLTNGIILNRAQGCPFNCSNNSPLMI